MAEKDKPRLKKTATKRLPSEMPPQVADFSAPNEEKIVALNFKVKESVRRRFRRAAHRQELKQVEFLQYLIDEWEKENL